MAQQYIMQQEIEQIASQYELGALQQEYDNRNIGGLLTCLALIYLLPSPWFIIFLISTFNISGLWSISFGIIALVVCLWIFGIVATLRRFYRDRYSHRWLYTYGFMVVKCQDEQIIASEAIHWRDITTIWRDVRRRRKGPSVDVYTLQRSNGEIFGKTVQKEVEGFLSGEISNLTLALGKHIEQVTLPYLWPGTISAYERGEPVIFGPLTVHTSGIQYQDTILPWNCFESFKEDREKGRLLIMPRDSCQFPDLKWVWALVASDRNPRAAYLRHLRPWAVVPYRQIPNLAVFLQLIEYARGNPLQYPGS